MFVGQLSREWLRLQPNCNDWKGNSRSAYIWGALIVEACQQAYIELWEQQNMDAHSPQVRIHLQKARAAKAIIKLYARQHHARFWYSALFPSHVEHYVPNSIANQLKQYVTLNRKVILNSVRRANASVIQHTGSTMN